MMIVPPSAGTECWRRARFVMALALLLATITTVVRVIFLKEASTRVQPNVPTKLSYYALMEMIAVRLAVTRLMIMTVHPIVAMVLLKKAKSAMEIVSRIASTE